ncbi:MAG TPA: GNAT family N-acetyltransferase [Euzebyales bacterium]
MPAPPPVVGGPVHSAAFAELDATTLYAILQLRAEVFVVEQRCAYCDPDGRDIDGATRHLWLADERGGLVAYARTLDEGRDRTRVGRVVTAPHARGHGLADRLVRHVVAHAPGPVLAAAQAHLTDWYAQRGFVVVGQRYVEDGIPHVPMRHPGPTAGRAT